MSKSGRASASEWGRQGLQRLFVAVPVPEQLFDFVRVAQSLLPSVDGLRLTREDQFHVTLAFIGEVDSEKATLAREVVRSVPSHLGGRVELGGFIFFPGPNKARVAALAIADPEQVLGQLFAHVMAGLERGNVMQREKRPFKPHLTIARLRTPVALQPRADTGRRVFAVDSVCLYESELRREGARYTVLERAALGDGQGGQQDRRDSGEG